MTDLKQWAFNGQVRYPGTNNTLYSFVNAIASILSALPINADVVYKITFRFPEEGKARDDESITLMTFPEADTIESFKYSHFSTVDVDEIVLQSIQYFNDHVEKENE